VPVSIRAVLTICGVLSLAAGCRHQPQAVPEPTRPPAGPNQDSIARAKAVRDSIARAEAARLERERADSILIANEAKAAAESNARKILSEPIHFDLDRTEILAMEQSLLERKVELLRRNPRIEIRIDGNTDERGSDEYNLALGMRRAAAAKQFLIQRGIDAARINTASNGEERPLCQDHDESCWSRNRRAEFVITSGGEHITASERR
jgi:peptidoglycan-associated lipoprotein